MASAADRYRDEVLRHGVDLERVKRSLVATLLFLLSRSEKELVDQLREEAERLGVGIGAKLFASSSRAKKIRAKLDQILEVRSEAWRGVREQLLENLNDLAVAEGGFHLQGIDEAVAIVELSLVAPTAAELRAGLKVPMRGALLSAWMSQLASDDEKRLRAAITQGLVEGQTLEQMVRTIRGTREQGFKDGVLQTSRREAEAIIRTAAAQVSSAARDAVFQANSDIVEGLIWVSTLDGRTTPICRSRDGKVTPLAGEPDTLPASWPRLKPADARPPAHWGCRSAMAAIFRGVGIVGNRPFVTSTLTGKARQVHFRDMAKEEAGAAWKTMTKAQRAAAVSAARSKWISANIGSVPAATTYQEWLTRQTEAFQVSLLGKTRAALFRRGGLKLDNFVDFTGEELTIAQLLKRYRSAFDRAGLLPG